MIIDSQVHAYAANTPSRPWNHVPNWPAHVTGDEMVQAMDAVGVDGAILVSVFSMYGWDASYAMQQQQAHPGRFGMVKPIDPDNPASADVIADWKKTPGTVGIRVMMAKKHALPADPLGWDRILKAAAQHDMPVNTMCFRNLDAATALIDRHPNTRFVIDHLGIEQPDTAPAAADAWADLPKVIELARRPNVAIKVSGAGAMSREGYPFDDIWDPLARVFDAWGFERCLWGTDWTRTWSMFSYEQATRPFLETKRISDSERALLMGGACAKAYGWAPAKPAGAKA